MKLSYFSLTPSGDRLCALLTEHLPGTVVTKETLKKEGLSFVQMVARLWPVSDGMVFVMASGIVVRTIAPLLASKATDPAVVVMDSRGDFVVSLLSGHLGGANDLAKVLAHISGGQPVITTGTDVEHTLAFDVFARDNHLRIENLKTLKDVSGAMIRKAPVGLWCTWPLNGRFPENVTIARRACEIIPQKHCKGNLEKPWVCIGHDYDVPEVLKKSDRTLYLRPQNLYIGVGCKREAAFEAMDKAFSDFLNVSGVYVRDVAALTTIKLKENEPAIRRLAKKYGLSLKIIDKDRIQALEDKGMVQVSAFVRSVTQVGSVSEACALAAAENAGWEGQARLIRGKTRYPAMTFALAEARPCIHDFGGML